jgi:hypothetical protein
MTPRLKFRPSRLNQNLLLNIPAHAKQNGRQTRRQLNVLGARLLEKSWIGMTYLRIVIPLYLFILSNDLRANASRLS